MQKSLTPVNGFLDEDIVTPSIETILFGRVIDGQLVTETRSMTTYDLSDYLDEVYGTTADEAIFAEAGDDKVNGGAGDDYIDGGAGMDTLYGGAGNDQILGGAGGDWLQGDAGNDVLIGGTGSDFMVGGTGDDFYVVADAGDVVTEYSGQGNDTVMSRLTTYTLAANVEDLIADTTLANTAVTFTGNALNNKITGAAGNDTLYGGAGNDQLDGKAGVDIMFGGTGNDHYRVENAADRTIEVAGEGTDSVTATLNWALDQNVENLFFESPGAYNKNFTGYGNELGNKIVGAGGADALYGFGGNDVIDGGDGFDALFGGTGDDTYFMDGDFDLITENAGEGYDRVYSNIADLYLQQNLESLDFYVSVGSNGQIVGASSFIGRGNTGDNRITGWELNDTLYGNDGNDTLYGLGGADTLDGGNGNDWLDGGSGANTLIGGAGNDTYVLTNDELETITETSGHDTVLTRDNDTLLADGVEDMRFTGTGSFHGTGNAGHNVITGGASFVNTLNGGAGNDQLIGGSQDDRLNGGTGADTMTGGLGDDCYVVDNIFDSVVESAGGGYDSVTSLLHNYTLAANVEMLWFQSTENCVGVGNDGNNVIVGDVGNDLLFGKAGNDILDGEEGNDRLDGGMGSNSLAGGEGKDAFVFNHAVQGQLQTVTDFVKGQDKIDFTGIDGNAALAGDQQLAFSFNGAFVGGGQGSFYVEKRAYDGTGSVETYVHVDCNGDGQMDLDIVLLGNSHYQLSISDFGL